MLNNIDLHFDSHLARHLTKFGKDSAWNIVIDNLITMIALTLGYYLFNMQEAMGSTKIDMEACISIKMIIKEEDYYFLVLKDQAPAPPSWPIAYYCIHMSKQEFP